MGKLLNPLSGKKKDKEKIDSSVEILSDSFEGFSDIGEKYDDASSGRTLSDEPEKTPHPVWFHLAPHKDENGMTLTVTLIQKFVATKLNLKDESEVDIFCAGERLSPNLTMGDIIDIWVKSIPNQEPIYVDSQEPGKSLYHRDIMLKLEYGRSKKPGFPKQK
ncbi:hypothetical protein F0562_029770 [Nyssa sinensis]|uniref:Uncharacterized protein n=1 Tax=Nyssa sinensis TaxID=561372 RepID=A0A5J5AWT8_9ASTE|nr:hypothetical protein F0562_029770 [Nyssa sinensis]